MSADLSRVAREKQIFWLGFQLGLAVSVVIALLAILVVRVAA